MLDVELILENKVVMLYEEKAPRIYFMIKKMTLDILVRFVLIERPLMTDLVNALFMEKLIKNEVEQKMG